MQKMDKYQPCVAVQHKLSEDEIDWFKRKTEDLENRKVFSEKESPERLLAFMVMLVKLGDLVEFHFGPAIVAFVLCVAMSMIASASFDPHAIWEEHE